MNTNNNPDGDGTLNPFDSIFAPTRFGDDGNGQNMGVSGNPQNDSITNRQEAGYNQDFQGQSQVGYSDVYADYADQANRSLETDYIPMGMKDVIREYFSSLEP